MLSQFSVFPFAKGTSIRAYVAKAIGELDKAALPYRVTDMGTIVEGEWDAVMAVVTACYQAMAVDCERVGVNIKIDARSGAGGRLRSKVDSVQAKVGRKLST